MPIALITWRPLLTGLWFIRYDPTDLRRMRWYGRVTQHDAGTVRLATYSWHTGLPAGEETVPLAPIFDPAECWYFFRWEADLDGWLNRHATGEEADDATD